MPRLRPLLLFLASAGCADDVGQTGGSTTQPTGATATPPTTGGPETPTTAAPEPTTGAGGDASSGSTAGVKYDLGFETGETGAIPGSACEQAEATLSNQGCVFWAVDLPNAWQVSLSPAPEEQTYAIVAANTASAAATVSVFAGDDAAALQTATIAGGETHVFALDDALGTKNRESSFGAAYRVESDLPITLYQFNPLDNSTEVFSNDASLLFPAHVLGRDYTAITGDAMRLGNLAEHDNAGAFVTIVGTVDATTVTLYPTPKVPLYPTALKLSLDRGQTYTLMSNAVMSLLQNEARQGNLSGTRVAADQPVAVFSGNVAAFEPTPQAGCCADHLEHQMLPLSAWGRAYVVVAAPPNTGTKEDAVRVRVTGSFDGTALSYAPAAPPGAPAQIGAYQTVVFTAASSFVVAGDQPFAVTEFLQSNAVVTEDPTPEDDSDDGFAPGDPAMILVPPTAQYQDRYVFLVPAEYAANFVTIVRPAGATVRLDDVDVTKSDAWAPVGDDGDTAWERGHFAIAAGPHRVRAEGGAKVGITVVGYDVAVSFGYAGGSGVELLGQPPFPPPV